MRRNVTRGFTLIELLVVVTIIVVLLALLTPALDKAIYQADLTMCGVHQRNIGNGVLAYAMQSKRAYPYRQGPRDLNNSWRPMLLFMGEDSNVPRYDDRVLLRDYVSIGKDLVCPLSGKIDLVTPHPNAWVYSNYTLWYGWQYHPQGVRQPGMFRLGDRFEWNAERFSYLSGEWHEIYKEQSFFLAAHPDTGDGARMAFGAQQNEFDTVSYWYTTVSTIQHQGPLDFNYALDDGSVVRHTDLKWDDPRLAEVPSHSTQQYTTWSLYLPRMNRR